MSDCAYPVSSDYYADFIFQHSNLTPEEIYQLAGTRCADYVNNNYAIVYRPLQDVLPLTGSSFRYSEIPKLYGLTDTTALESSGILPVFEQPALNSTGKNVIIGIIDTGIQYENPVFRNTDGSTCILGLWDQTIEPVLSGDNSAGAAPSFPSYGSVYSREDINLALAAENPLSVVPSSDTNGHGTFMAGVAAGRRLPEESFSGAAPDAYLAVVKLKPAKQYLRDYYLIREDADAFQENDIMTGIRYLSLVAIRYQLPLVIYLGVGTNQGSHTGSSPLGRQLGSYGGILGVSAVLGSGNEVGYRLHASGSVSPDAEYADIELRVAENETGFTMELWAPESDLFTVGFVSPSGEVIRQLALLTENEFRIPFSLETTVITLNYRTSETGAGSQLISMRFAAPSPGIWHIRVYPVVSLGGLFHIWLPMHGFLSDGTYFLRPDPDTTIVEPGNALFPITVSAFNHLNNSIDIHSSRGYTRNNQVKPDIAAPGVHVYGPGLSTGNELRFTRKSGTSVAAALTAGAVADLLSWAIPGQNALYTGNANIKTALRRGADRNPALSYPNREFGYGTLNLYHAFRGL